MGTLLAAICLANICLHANVIFVNKENANWFSASIVFAWLASIVVMFGLSFHMCIDAIAQAWF